MGTQPSRVQYFPKQYLRTQDMTDEQAYHLEMRRRHNVAGHSWGIVSGLELLADKTIVRVQPGLAIDGYGRELVVATALLVPNTDPHIERGPLDVWLTYDTQVGDPITRLDNGCAPSQGGTLRRLLEGAQVVTHKAGVVAGGPSKPSEVPPGDLDFGPERAAPDAKSQRWPVFLGRITFVPSGTDPVVGSWSIDLSDRLYAGLVGQSVRAPSTRTTVSDKEHAIVPAAGSLVQLGPTSKSDSFHFAVYVPGEVDANNLRFGLDTDGNLNFQGPETRIQGDLVIDNGGSVELEANGPPAAENASENIELAPWRIYHYLRLGNSLPAKTPPAKARASTPSSPPPSDGFTEELRITMSGAEGSGSNTVVIGAWSDKGKFVPCLTVGSDQQVTVHGNLVVQGEITSPSFQQAPPNFNPAALNVTTAAANVASFVVPPGTPAIAVLATLLSTPDGMSLVSTALVNSAGGPAAFGDALNASSKPADFMGAILDKVIAAPATLPVIATKLLGAAGGVDAVTNSPALDDGKAKTLALALLGRPAIIPDAAVKIVNSTSGPAAIGDALNASSKPADFMGAILDKVIAAPATLPTMLPVIATKLLGAPGGPKVVADNLDLTNFATAPVLDDAKATTLAVGLLKRPTVASAKDVLTQFASVLTAANVGALTATFLADTDKANAIGKAFPADVSFKVHQAFAAGLNSAPPGTQQLGPIGKVLFASSELIKTVAAALDDNTAKFSDFVDNLSDLRFQELLDAMFDSKGGVADRMPDVAAKLLTGATRLTKFVNAVSTTGTPSPLLSLAVELFNDATRMPIIATALPVAPTTGPGAKSLEQLLSPFIQGLTSDADATHRSPRATAFVSALIDYPNTDDTPPLPVPPPQRLGMIAIEASLHTQSLTDPIPAVPDLKLAGTRRLERFMQFLHEVPAAGPGKSPKLVFAALQIIS